MSRSLCQATFMALILGVSSAWGHDDPLTEEHILLMSPQRVWGAVQQQLTSPPEGFMLTAINDERFEAHLTWTNASHTDQNTSFHLDVDWDAHSGGTRLRWMSTAHSDHRPSLSSSAQAWMQQLLNQAQQSQADNLLCRGPNPSAEEIAAAQIEIPGNCRYSTGHFSSALFELEKCGDFDTALQIMADCVNEQHAGGLIRLSHYFDMGYGVPKRPERALEFLKMAMNSSKEGYAQLARLHYATALHFGIGIPPDPSRARPLFEELAAQGQVDAQEFLRVGHHGAWLRPDGQRHRDAPVTHTEAATVSKDDSGNDLSYGAFIDSNKRLKCLYGYAAEKTGDHAAAVRIFEDCISRWNDPYSIIWLAHLLENGVAVPQDLPRAAQLLRQGAMLPETTGYPSLIRYHYGMALLQGQGVPVDHVQARYWLARAAAEGVSEAQTILLQGTHQAHTLPSQPHAR